MTKSREQRIEQVKTGPPTAEEVALPWLTIEVALYGAIFIVALSVRLASLGQWPLLETGANTALAAWRTVQGSTWRPAYYIPLLYDANLLLFWMTRASDAAATLLPALVGAGLVIVPYFARDLLGRKASLVTALLLALAPTWVFYSRTADGPILTAAASALVLLSAYRLARSGEGREARLGAIALGLGLTAGPGLYTTLLVVVVWGGIAWWLWREEGAIERARSLVLRAATRENLMWLVGTFLFFGSGFLVNPGGVGASIGLAGYWAQRLAPHSSGLPWWALGRNLLGYEYLTVALGLVGGAWGLYRRDKLDIALLIWAVVALILGTALGHRDSTWMLNVLLPLAILAGRGAAWLWDRLVPGASLNDGIVLAAGLAIVAFGYIELVTYLHTGQERYMGYARMIGLMLILAGIVYRVWSNETSRTARIVGSVLAVALVGLEVLIYSLALSEKDLATYRIIPNLLAIAALAYVVLWGRDSAARAGAALSLFLMICGTTRLTTALAYQTGRDPREGMLVQPSSVQIKDLEELIMTLSSRQAGDPRAISLDYEQVLDPWIGWILREYPKARPVASIDPRTESMALITRMRAKEEWPAGFMGQTFRLRETWDDATLSSRARLRWAIMRDPVGKVQATEVYLWVRPPTAKR